MSVTQYTASEPFEKPLLSESNRELFLKHQALISFLWDCWKDTRSREVMRILIAAMDSTDVLV